jgi:hypothetical protein
VVSPVPAGTVTMAVQIGQSVVVNIVCLLVRVLAD